jgi:broad specificity phosphatase PhoE
MSLESLKVLLEGKRKDVASKTTVLERYATAAYHYSIIKKEIDDLPTSAEKKEEQQKIVLDFGSEVMDPARTDAIGAGISTARLESIDAKLSLPYEADQYKTALDALHVAEKEYSKAETNVPSVESKTPPDAKKTYIDAYDAMIVAKIKATEPISPHNDLYTLLHNNALLQIIDTAIGKPEETSPSSETSVSATPSSTAAPVNVKPAEPLVSVKPAETSATALVSVNPLSETSATALVNVKPAEPLESVKQSSETSAAALVNVKPAEPLVSVNPLSETSATAPVNVNLAEPLVSVKLAKTPAAPPRTEEQPTTRRSSRSCNILVSIAEKAKLKKLADDPNYTGPDINEIENILKQLTFTFILVRHGISLSNLKKASEKQKGVFIHSHTFISDPRLTDAGIAKAYNRGLSLKTKLSKDFPECTPIVWSSLMLRAQMTAALMLNPDTVTVIPYASELSTVVRMATDTPEPFESQTKRLVKILTDIPRNAFLKKEQKEPCINRLAVNKRTLYSPFPLSGGKRNTMPDVGSFLEFVKDEYFKLPGMSLDDTEDTPNRPLVIFTHGHFIEEVIRAVGGGKILEADRPNYSAFKFTVKLFDDIITYDGPYTYVDSEGTMGYEMSTTLDATEECTDAVEKEMKDACA